MDSNVELAQHGPRMTGFGNHLVHFHERDEELEADVADFIGTALSAGEGAIVVATADHLDGIVRGLRSAGVDPTPVLALDAQDTLDRILTDGGRTLDVPRLRATVTGALEAAVARAAVRRVHVFGEMVALLWDRGQVSLAMDLEAAWNRLARGPIPFTLLCGYRMPAIDDDAAAADRFFDACGHHTGVRCGARERTEAWRRFDDAARDLPGARAFVRGTLGGWGHHVVATEAAVVVTELATNAVLHARTPFHVSVSQGDGRVRIAVHDGSDALPERRAYGPDWTSGRGLHLVQSLSVSWGVDQHAGLKSVWAELPSA